MNGKDKFLLDTNAIINLLKENNHNYNLKKIAGEYFVSIITEIELLCFKELADKKEEEERIKRVIPDSCVLQITKEIKEKTIELKRKNPVKLPDAVICATAIVKRLRLVTDDKRLFNIPELDAVSLLDLVNPQSLATGGGPRSLNIIK